MDCRTARLLLDFARPLLTELEPGEAEALQCHLADCPECGALARTERAANQVLGQAMRAVPVPDGLRDRLLDRLEAQRGVGDRRRWLRRAAAVAMAAGVLAALWLGLEWRNQPVRLDAYQVADSFFGQVNNPMPDNVEDAFQQRGVHAVVPRQFNYPALLKYYGLAELQGKQVPVLVFVQGKDQARVYVLSDRQFDLKYTLSNPPTCSSGGCRVEVRANPNDPHFAYLIVYTGDSLRPFLSDREPSTT